MADLFKSQLNLYTSEQKLVFSSPEHQTTLQKSLHRQWIKGQNCDLLFSAGSCDLPVHSCVAACFSTKISHHLQRAEVASASPNGQEAYSATEGGVHFSFCKTGQKKVGVEVSRDIVEALVGFMYTGSLSIPCSRTSLLLDAAHLLGLSLVVQIVEVFVRRNPDMAQLNLVSGVSGVSEEASNDMPGTECEDMFDDDISAYEETGVDRQSNLSKMAGRSETMVKRTGKKSGRESLCLDSLQLDIKQEMMDTDLQAFLDTGRVQGTKQTVASAGISQHASDSDSRKEEGRQEPLSVFVKQEVMEDVPVCFASTEEDQEPQQSSADLCDSGSRHHVLDFSAKNTEVDRVPPLQVASKRGGKTTRKNGSFHCPHCPKTYISNTRLHEHVFKVHERKKFQQKTCPHCDQQFEEKEKLKSHCREVHGDFVCDVEGCDFRTAHPRTSRKHMTTAHGKRKFPCSKCDHQATTKKGLHEHQTLSHAEFSCSICKRNFLQKDNLTQHLRSVHKTNTFPCRQCEDCFTSETTLLMHCQEFHGAVDPALYSGAIEASLSTVTKSESSPLSIAEAGVESQIQLPEPQLNLLLAAVQSVENATTSMPLLGKRRYRRFSKWNCRLCGKQRDSKKALFEHLSVEHKGHIFSCQQCPQQFLRKESLTKHIREHHQGRCWTCSICGELFTVSTRFADHSLKQHNIQKPFVCLEPGCAFKSGTIKSLECHKKFVHAKERNEVCYKCGSCFPSQLYLRNHQRSCLQLEQHLCSICGAVFSLRQSLMSHINNKHGGERRYSCVQCGQRFSCHANRNRHMRIHNNAFPYMCDICGQKFRHSNSLKDHVRRKHGDQPLVKNQM